MVVGSWVGEWVLAIVLGKKRKKAIYEKRQSKGGTTNWERMDNTVPGRGNP